MADAAVKYKGLVKTRAKAMSIFQKAYDQLAVAVGKVESAKATSAAAVQAAEQAIAEEKANQQFLDTELASIKATQDKISEFLG